MFFYLINQLILSLFLQEAYIKDDGSLLIPYLLSSDGKCEGINTTITGQGNFQTSLTKHQLWRGDMRVFNKSINLCQ